MANCMLATYQDYRRSTLGLTLLSSNEQFTILTLPTVSKRTTPVPELWFTVILSEIYVRAVEKVARGLLGKKRMC